MEINDNDNDVTAIVQKLEMSPHPEGGYYRRVFQSDHSVGVDSARYGASTRPATSVTYFMLCDKAFAAWHRVKSDEMWNFCAGSSMHVLTLDPDTGEVRSSQGSCLRMLVLTVFFWICHHSDKSA